MTARKFHTFRFVGSPSVRNLCASLAKEPSLGGQNQRKDQTDACLARRLLRLARDLGRRRECLGNHAGDLSWRHERESSSVVAGC